MGELIQVQTTMSELTITQLSSAFKCGLVKIITKEGIQRGLLMETLHQQRLLSLQPQQHLSNISDFRADFQCCLVRGKN